MRAKKIIAAFMAVLILILTLSSPVFCEQTEQMPDTSKVGAIWLYCLDTDSVVIKENAEAKMFPAGFVKLMTAIVARDFIQDPFAVVTLKSSVSVSTQSTNYTKNAGDSVTYDDLFKLMLMQNSNEAANALAKLCCENVSDFVALMNQRAEQIGMTNTMFSNATGVDYMAQHTTAADAGVLVRAFWGDQYLSKTSAYANVRLSEHFDSSMIYSRNYLFSSYYNSGKKYTDNSVMAGISTSTSNAGHCIGVVKEYKGKLYMCVIMAGKSNSSGEISTFELLPKIVKWGGDSFTYVSVLNKWTSVGEIDIKHGLGYDHASLFCSDNVSCYMKKSVDPDVDIRYEYKINEKELTAPISAGYVVGTAKAYYEGELIASSDIVIVNSIARNESSVLSSRVAKFLTSRGFISFCIVFILVFVIYVLCMAKYRAYKQKRRQQQEQ